MKAVLPILKRMFFASWPVLFLALVTCGVFFTTIVLRHRTFYVFPDNIDQFYAWYQKLAYAVHHGTLPIWDASVSAGHSFVGELQAGVFYPINWLWVGIFGSTSGISVYWLEWIVVLHFWIASAGMYYAARSLGLGKIGALASGMAFAFGGTIAVRSVSQTAIFFGMCYIPWAFFWFNDWLRSGKKLKLVWCSLALAFAVLAGHINPWYFSCLLIGLFILLRSPHPSFESWLRTVGKRLVTLVIVVAGSLFIAAPQIALSAQYLPQAVRFVGDAQPITTNQRVGIATFIKTFSFKPQDFLSLVNPKQYPVVDGNELYVGLAGLGMIATVLVVCRRALKEHVVWRLYGRFLVGASAVATVIMLGYWTFIPAVLRLLPFVSQVRQLARYSVIVHFCLAIMVGVCLEVLARSVPELFKTKKRLLVGLGAGTVLVVFLALNTIYFYFLSKHTGSIDRHFVYQNGIITLALAGCLLLRTRIQYVLLGAMVLSSLVAPVWFMPHVADFPTTYPPNYYKRTAAITYLEQYYGKARVQIEDNALPVNIGDVYNIQTINGYGATLHKAFYQYLNEPDPKGQAGRHLDALNVRFMVSKKVYPRLHAVLYDTSRGVYVYERPTFAPRAYFAQDYNACVQQAPECTPVTITKYADADIVTTYNAPQAGQLVLSEVVFDGWKAYVDGKPAPITTYAPKGLTPLFRAVNVPQGRHQVEYRYRPFGL